MRADDSDSIAIGWDGAAMLALSALVVVLTGGLSLLAAGAFVLRQALRTPTAASPGHGPVVVLGRRLARDGRACPAFRARLDRSRVLAANSPAPIIILGGATRPGLPAEAAAGAAYLMAQGVPAGRILMEGRSRHTLENLRGLRRTTAGLPDGGRPVLVTSRLHLARAAQMAAFMGLTLTPCAAEDRFAPSMALLSETLLIHWYLTGRLVTEWTGSRRLADRIT